MVRAGETQIYSRWCGGVWRPSTKPAPHVSKRSVQSTVFPVFALRAARCDEDSFVAVDLLIAHASSTMCWSRCLSSVRVRCCARVAGSRVKTAILCVRANMRYDLSIGDFGGSVQWWVALVLFASFVWMLGVVFFAKCRWLTSFPRASVLDTGVRWYSAFSWVFPPASVLDTEVR